MASFLPERERGMTGFTANILNGPAQVSVPVGFTKVDGATSANDSRHRKLTQTRHLQIDATELPEICKRLDV
ncbi:MAG: hypothetical protein C0483_13520 [Pirellula sp.]|nr:hypothetical protein [Pirellula sp.]